MSKIAYKDRRTLMIEAQLVNPFLVAAYEVFDNLMDIKVNKGNIWSRDTSVTTSEVSVLVNFTGSIHGQIIYGMNQHTAKLIASRLIDKPIRILNDLSQSALAELGNMISGHATTNIEEEYPNISLDPPAIIVGSNILVSTINLRRLYVEMLSEIGNLEVSIIMRRKPIPNLVSITYHHETKIERLA